MLIQNQTLRNRYTGNGITTEFPYTFPILESSHIKVLKEVTEIDPVSGASVTKSEQIPSSAYTITGVGLEQGGTIVFNSAPEVDLVLTFIRDVPFTQLYKYTELDNFPAESHENALAKLTMMCLQLLELSDRSLTLPATSTQNGEDFVNELVRMFDVSVEAEKKIREVLQQLFSQSIVPFTTVNGVLEYETGTDYVDPDANNLLLVKDHVVQQPIVAYTIIEPNKIRFTENPGDGAKVWGISSLSFANPDIRSIIDLGITQLETLTTNGVNALTDEGTLQLEIVQAAGVAALAELNALSDSSETDLTNLANAKYEEIRQMEAEQVEQARAWAESDTPPDPDDPLSKSAKQWAQEASTGMPVATYDTPGKVQIDDQTLTINAAGLLSVPEATMTRIYDLENEAAEHDTDIVELKTSTANLSAQSGTNTANISALTSQVAENTADISTFNNLVQLKTDGTVALKGQRSTTGAWTLAGLKAKKPLIMTGTFNGGGCVIESLTNSQISSSDVLVFGEHGNISRALSFVIIPSSTSITCSVRTLSTGAIVKVYQ